MPKKKKSTDKNNEETHENSGEDKSLEDEKRVVNKQINELEDLIVEIEFSLSLTKYGNIENIEKLKPKAVETKKVRKLKNLDHILQHELYKLSGLYCTKCVKHEYIFNFSPFSNTKNDSVYSIQFFTHNGKGSIGKYILPASGVMENILDETPIDKLNNLIPFFRNCKRHLECFVDRREQFEELKEVTSEVKNIRMDADLGYVLITCSFLQVYHKASDKLIDMTVYLAYDYGKARPSTLNVDWSIKKKPSEDDAKGMRSFMKIFRTLSLVEAYRELKNSNHKNFTWSPAEADPDEVLNINDVSEGSDESDEEVSRPTGKRRAPRKRGRSPSPELRGKTGEDEEEQELSEEIEKKPVKRKKRAEPEPKAQPEKKKKKAESFKTPQTRQSTLNFAKIPGKDSEKTTPIVKNRKKTTKTMTSTPMHRNLRGKAKSSPPGALNISPIVADEKKKEKTPLKKKK